MVTIYPLTPFSRYTCCNTVLTRSVAAVFLSANIIRVFATSNGVVVAAAKAPARAPQFATSHDSKRNVVFEMYPVRRLEILQNWKLNEREGNFSKYG
jgi:hypothetical protein